jgi:hypothetical protein
MKRAGRGTFAEILVAARSRVQALDGDCGLLAARVLLRGTATLEERELLIQLLMAGKLKFGGRKRLQVKARDALIAWMVRTACSDGLGVDAAVAYAQARYRVARSQVYRILAKTPDPVILGQHLCPATGCALETRSRRRVT